MESGTGYIAKTEAEIKALSIDEMTARFYEMQNILKRQKQMLQDIFAIDTANLNVMEIAADAVIQAQQQNTEQSLIDEYDMKYSNAIKNVNASTDRRRALLHEAEIMKAEIQLIVDIVTAIHT